MPKIYFVSPHFDDAILSAGSLIKSLSDKATVTVINVFTTAKSTRSTFSARRLMQKCGFADAAGFYRARDLEDQLAINRVGAKRLNLGFVDGMWRKIPRAGLIRRLLGAILPEFLYIYPTYRLHLKSRIISPYDLKIVDAIEERLKKIISKDGLVFCPLSVGDHIDHVIVRQACERLGVQLYYWTDYPYIAEVSQKEMAAVPVAASSFSLPVNIPAKEKAIKSYRSQLKMLFPDNKINLGPEVYYYNEASLARPSLTIGIPAYNEAANVKNLLLDIYKQTARTYVLKEVIVVSDGSTDHTVKEIKLVNNKNLRLIKHPNRQGLAATENEIFSLAQSDICLLLQADIRLDRRDCLDQLIHQMKVGNSDLVSGNLRPVLGHSFFNSVLYAGSLWKHSAFSVSNGGINLYTCYGPIRAFSRRLYRSLRLPRSVGEDMYSYLFAQSRGYRYDFAPQALVSYQLPENLRDHLRQSLRFFHSAGVMNDYFDPELVNTATRLPIDPLRKAAIQLFWSYPLKLSLYFLLSAFFSALSFLSTHYRRQDQWEVSFSSKQLRT